MVSQRLHFLFLLLLCSIAYRNFPGAVLAELPGTWELLVADAGIASMDTAVTRFNTVILLDRTDIGPSRKLLPNCRCRHDPHDPLLKRDCYAHSAVLDLSTNVARPLTILTDTWCPSGQFLPDGSFLHTGDNQDDFRKCQKFEPPSPVVAPPVTTWHSR